MAYTKEETIIGNTNFGQKIVEVVLKEIDLTAGVKEVTLDKVGKIATFIGGVSKNENTNDYVKAFDIERSTTNPNNGLKITVNKMQISAVQTWGAAVTADIDTAVVRLLVVGI